MRKTETDTDCLKDPETKQQHNGNYYMPFNEIPECQWSAFYN